MKRLRRKGSWLATAQVVRSQALRDAGATGDDLVWRDGGRRMVGAAPVPTGIRMGLPPSSASRPSGEAHSRRGLATPIVPLVTQPVPRLDAVDETGGPSLGKFVSRHRRSRSERKFRRPCSLGL